MGIVFFIIFVLCLSLLIVVHELGHLTAAKIFKVYCFEYSIGFGPKIFSYKRKNGETSFSLRVVPFGGYVSMYGEGVEVPEGVEIPPERSLNNIKKWKRAIILVAGVFMNAVLALIIFLISNTAFTQKDVYVRYSSVQQDSLIYNAVKDDPFYQDGLISFDINEFKEDTSIFVIDKEATVHYKPSLGIDDAKVAMVLNGTELLGYSKLDWDYYLQFYLYKNEETMDEFEKNIAADEIVDYVTFTIKTTKYNPDSQEWEVGIPYNLQLNCNLVGENKYEFDKLGSSFYLDEYRYGFGKAVGETFHDFGRSASAIFKTLGSLITSQKARDSVGGIVAIGFVSSNTLKNFGFNSFIRIWAMISVNLAIMNLLPFPGLDGWQLLVLVVEGTFRKEIPPKVKNIVSFVGIVLLMGLMLLLVIKDVTQYIL